MTIYSNNLFIGFICLLNNYLIEIELYPYYLFYKLSIINYSGRMMPFLTHTL